MKKFSFLFLIIATAFCFGFATKSIFTKNETKMKKVTGIGGIFFKCKDSKAIKEWYAKNLGLPTDDYGATFEWYGDSAGTKPAQTQWSPFKETTKYFEPSTKEFMINYRVENIEALVAELKQNGVTVVDEIENTDYGKFVHIMDIEGNKIELWEATKSK